MGNMTCRIEGGETFLQAYNAENRMSGVLLVTGNCDTLGDTLKAWEITYDGDGVKVKQEYTDANGTLTTYYYASGSYEVQTDGTTETERQYYTLAGVSAGMREGSTFYYFLTDHLGSVVGVTDATGTLVSETRYLPFGEVRTDVGSISQTDYGYTFQRNVSQMGLVDYKARYYSTLLGRFIQPDTIIPSALNPQSWNHFIYVMNNPLRYIDYSGHRACDDVDRNGNCITYETKYVSGFTKKQLANVHQYQGNTPDCGSFSLAMAIELIIDEKISGDDVDDFLIRNKNKTPGFGIQGQALAAGADLLLPNNKVEYANNGTLNQIKQNVDEGLITIVGVSNQTTNQILKDVFDFNRNTNPTVGHWMIVAGYDEENIILLDPGNDPGKPNFNPFTTLTYNDFLSRWTYLKNIFIGNSEFITFK